MSTNTILIDQYESFNIYIEPYYYNNNYYHILTLNKEPLGPLKEYVKMISIKNVSSKINKANESYCSYIINKNILANINTLTNINTYTDTTSEINICTIDNLTEIHDYLINNNYIINERLSNTFKNINNINNNSKKIILVMSYKII